MANFNNMYNPNQGIMNQLLRQRDNVENMIQQYSQMPTQAPIQNIINQNSSLDFEARILNDGEDLTNIAINRRTLFVDEKNKKISIKELDGTISKEYEIIVPLDEKDIRIKTLEEEINTLKDEIINMKKNTQQQNRVEQNDKQVNKKINETSK